MTPSLLLVYLFGILNVQGYKRLSETRLEGTHTAHDGIDSSVMCCVLCEVKDTCIAVSHNKDLGVCEVVQTSGVKLRPTTDSLWTVYFKYMSDIDYKYGATANQSTTSLSGVASHAIDGRVELDRCTTTHYSFPNWLLIDFNRNYPIKEFSIWQDPFETMAHLVITVSKKLAGIDGEKSLCTVYTGPAPQDVNPVLMSCNKTMEGRFFKIHKNFTRRNHLIVCEVDLL